MQGPKVDKFIFWVALAVILCFSLPLMVVLIIMTLSFMRWLKADHGEGDKKPTRISVTASEGAAE